MQSEKSSSAAGEGNENAVIERYARGAQAREAALCCPISYDPKLLRVIPAEIIERDYGCGDPSQFVRPGDTVLDLGSGSGKIAYIAAQIAGRTGRVIGVDFNPAMLSLARKYQTEVAAKIGFANVEFRRGKIQDLALDLDALERALAERPVKSVEDLQWLAQTCEQLRQQSPLIESGSIDLVLSNCVLNLVNESEKQQLFSEIFRVTRIGGRVAISDIVSDESIPDALKADADLWSGCVSGAFQEEAFLAAFEEAGFRGIELVKRDEKPWRVINGIEFRAVTVLAHKVQQGPSLDRNQAVIYRGPFKQVIDDEGTVFERGVRQAVSDKTFELFQSAYAQHVYPVPPHQDIPATEALPFESPHGARRDPRQSKGMDYRESTDAGSCCEPGCCDPA